MYINYLSREQLLGFTSVRAHEQKQGQNISFVKHFNDLERHFQDGCRYIIIGVPEDIGPRANLGRGGSDGGWEAFLSCFMNYQVNECFPTEQLLLLGSLQTADLQQQAEELDNKNEDDLNRLRSLTQEIDNRLSPIIELVTRIGFKVIVIGGGHNNAFPIIKGVSQAKNSPLACTNLDPHSDFRILEGRHSGNGFSYACDQNYLSHYHVLGLHSQKNAAANLASMATLNFGYVALQDLIMFPERHNDYLQDACDYITDSELPSGVEIDLDVISRAPVSAYNVCGVSFDFALRYVHHMASLPKCQYLHLAEGAPAQHHQGPAAGKSEVGQMLSELTYCFVRACSAK